MMGFELLITSMLAATPYPTWVSGTTQTHVLELFTSEGCSSCPPAERYLLTLREDPALWKTVIPVQFHVDYWDYLGWPDAYARPAYTERQRQYATQWGDGSVYTPCFVRDGAPTRAPWQDLMRPGPEVGPLQVVQTNADTFRVRFTPLRAASGKARITGVVVAQNIRQKVRAGENRGRTLDHAFVALSAREVPLHVQDGAFVGTITLEHRRDAGPVYVAFWVTRDNDMTPVQAVGGLWRAP